MKSMMVSQRVAILLWAVTISAVFGQNATNSWTSPADGNWQDLTWSLGVRPDIGQAAILITNNGPKAVVISPVTVSNYPKSLVISNLTIAGTATSTNTLLVDRAGTQTPLQIFNSCTVGSNGVLVNLAGGISLQDTNAALRVSGGAVNQSGGSNVFAGPCYIGCGSSYGTYNLTNGSAAFGSLQIGDAAGGVFNQLGGSTVVSNELWMGGISFPATYNFLGSSLSASNLVVGGTRVTNGSGTAGFYQGGGSVLASNLLVGAGASYQTAGGVGYYYLTSGSLSTEQTGVGNHWGAKNGSSFAQYGGTHRTQRLRVGYTEPAGPHGLIGSQGIYLLDDGMLFAESVKIGSVTLDSDTSMFVQSGGTNQILGDLRVDGAYELSSGRLTADSVYVSVAAYGQGLFFQSGGSIVVSNALGISGSFRGGDGAHYEMSGGSLSCGSVESAGIFNISNAMVKCIGTLTLAPNTYGQSRSILNFSGGSLSCDSLILESATVFNHGSGTLIASNITVGAYASVTLNNENLTCGNFVLTEASSHNDQLVLTFPDGRLNCENLEIEANRIFVQGGSLTCGNITLAANAVLASQGTLTNSGQIRFAGGTLDVGNATEQLGSIVLSDSSTDYVFRSPCIQHFSASAQNPWNPNAVFNIFGWQGSPSGGGSTRIYVGNDASGLTVSQLQQIRFIDTPGGPYAKILSTGEIVPSTIPPIPSLSAVKSVDRTVLSWQTQTANTWALLYATNILGPWFETIGALPPFAVPASLKEQYFQLRNGPPWLNADVGNVAITGSASTSNGVWTLSGDGPDIWGTADGFQFVYQPWSGDGSITARVLACEPTDPYAKAGVMFRASLDPASANYATVVNAQSGSQSQWRTNTGAQTYSDWFKWSNIPYWVKVSRRTNTFLGSISPDGTNWTMLTAQNIPMIDPIYAGLAASSHTTNALNNAMLDNVSFSSDIAPLPWAKTDVGSVYLAGSSAYSNGTFTITSFGFDCWSTADQFQCIYQPLSGDATVTVHIASMQDGDPWAKAGVMLRNDLGAGAPYSATILTPANGTVLQRRFLANNGTAQMGGPNLKAPCWLQIVRQGNAFYNYVSSNGATWTLIGNADAINMGATAYAVLFATTHASAQAVSETAAFDSIRITQP